MTCPGSPRWGTQLVSAPSRSKNKGSTRADSSTKQVARVLEASSLGSCSQGAMRVCVCVCVVTGQILTQNHSTCSLCDKRSSKTLEP